MLKLRSPLRSIKAQCMRFRQFQAVTMEPIMCDLPNERLLTSFLPSRTPALTTLGRSMLLSAALLRKGGASSLPVSLLALSMSR